MHFGGGGAYCLLSIIARHFRPLPLLSPLSDKQPPPLHRGGGFSFGGVGLWWFGASEKGG